LISRDALTKIFLKQWGKTTDDVNVIHYSHLWWKSNRIGKENSFRLTVEGLEFLTNILKIESYDINFPEVVSFSPQTIIFFERYLDCPYFLDHGCVTVFSERKSFELSLFSDDIEKFGLSKAMKTRNSDKLE
jgi:hypothetical protein